MLPDGLGLVYVFLSLQFCCFHESYSRSDYLSSLSRCLAFFLTVFFVALFLLWLQRYWKVWQYETAEVRSGGKTSQRNYGQAILAELVLHHWSLLLFLPLLHIPRLPLQAPNMYHLIFSCSPFKLSQIVLLLYGPNCFKLTQIVLLLSGPNCFFHSFSCNFLSPLCGMESIMLLNNLQAHTHRPTVSCFAHLKCVLKCPSVNVPDFQFCVNVYICVSLSHACAQGSPLGQM